MADSPGKLLALDMGEARIGVATCDGLGLTVRPLAVIARKSRRKDFDEIAAIIRREGGVDGIVCGLPLNMDGSEGPQAQTTRRWAGRLVRALTHILGQSPPVRFWDERLSSFAADEILAQESRYAKIGQDAVAAAVILQSYLEAQRRNASETYGSIIPS